MIKSYFKVCRLLFFYCSIFKKKSKKQLYMKRCSPHGFMYLLLTFKCEQSVYF